MRRPVSLAQQMAVIDLYVQVRSAGKKIVMFEIGAQKIVGVGLTTAYKIIKKAKIDGKIKVK
jgi:ribosomal protein S13